VGFFRLVRFHRRLVETAAGVAAAGGERTLVRSTPSPSHLPVPLRRVMALVASVVANCGEDGERQGQGLGLGSGTAGCPRKKPAPPEQNASRRA
jgi:hypothetical protein